MRRYRTGKAKSMGGDEEKHPSASVVACGTVGLSTEINNKEVVEQKEEMKDAKPRPLLGKKKNMCAIMEFYRYITVADLWRRL